MAFMKLYYTSTPTQVVVRVESGRTRETAENSGTFVLPKKMFEQFLDALVIGAHQVRHDGEKLDVYFGPDDGPQRA